MAKVKKIVNRGVRSKKIIRRKINKKKSSFNLKYPIFVLIILIILFVGLVKLLEASSIKQPKFTKHLPVKSKELKVKSLITPYPTPTIKATPTTAPLVGYCLHVPVLMYHHIQPEATAKQLGQTALTVDSEIFDTQMKYLSSQGYTTLFADELVNALISHQGLPAKSVVITMDDGYEDNYIYALPVLQKYGLKANIMLASGLMNNSNMLSWDEVKSLKNSGHVYFTNHTWSHYPVTKQPQVKIEMEIDTAQREIQDETGQKVNIFTYPYGQFNNNAIITLQAKGYIGAFTEIPGQYQCDSFLMTLHRTRIGNGSLSYYGL